MSYHVESCGRCEAKITESDHRAPDKQQFYRELGGGKHEADSIRLCSMCLDDVWEFVFDVEVDRSDRADPVPLNRVTDSVQRHIDSLEELREDLDR